MVDGQPRLCKAAQDTVECRKSIAWCRDTGCIKLRSESRSDQGCAETFAIETKGRDLVMGINQAKVMIEFYPIKHDRRVQQADMFRPQIAMPFEHEAIGGGGFDLGAGPLQHVRNLRGQHFESGRTCQVSHLAGRSSIRAKAASPGISAFQKRAVRGQTRIVTHRSGRPTGIQSQSSRIGLRMA
ncbi:hypothetical protein [Roseicyclus marinus]|uniref:hypothetical protein n=1 Tax=Roseicyclus marinus TaxID=2161673 RepID=UPI0030C6E08F